jgi:hypothetical protein
VNDCAKAVLSAWLLNRFLPDPIRFTSMRDFGVYFGVAALLSRRSAPWLGRQRASVSATSSGPRGSNGFSAT